MMQLEDLDRPGVELAAGGKNKKLRSRGKNQNRERKTEENT